MQSLFPSAAVGGPRANSAPLFQLKAGKCQLTSQSNGKFLVTADVRRGQISLHRSSDGLLHFKWSNMVNGAVEDDRIVMPGESSFKQVKAGHETRRVYLLKFRAGGQRLMYWLQDKDDSKDEENIKKLNELLNNPAVATTSTPGSTASNGAPGISPDLMQLFG